MTTPLNKNTTPDYCTLSDRELVLKIFASPFRRTAVEFLVLEMERYHDQGRFEVTAHGRRVAVVPWCGVREVLLPKDCG